MSIITDRASLYCHKEDKEFIDELVGHGSPETKLFEDRLDAYFTFACLGYAVGWYMPIEAPSDRQELTLSSYYAENKNSILVLAALAYEGLREREDEPPSPDLIAESLSRFTKIIPLVEGWANGGVKYLRQRMQDGGLSNPGTIGLAGLVRAQIEEQMGRV